MKPYFAALCGLGLLLPLGQTAQADCTPVPADLVSWWRGEGNATDVQGINHGTLSSAGAGYATGLVGQGFRFDGTNGYAQIPDAPALKPANVTAEAWVWLDPALPANRGGEQIVFKKNTWSAWFEGYSLLKVTIDNGNGTSSDRFQFCVSRTGNQVAINSTTIAERGVWYHVAATYDGNQSTLYVNGVAEATAAPGFALDYGTDPVYLGTSGTWPPYLSMFGGVIDEPSIYSRALASNEIAAIYNAGSAGKCSALPPAVLVDGNTPGYYNDSLGTILDGTAPQFPLPYFSGGGDPDIHPSTEPGLSAAEGVLGDWLAPTPVLNGNWSYEPTIPSTWALNTETAIIYVVDGGSQGLVNVRGDFDADNGLFVWVNGQYKFGAVQPGLPSPAGQFEYTNVDLGPLVPGPNYIQVLREDNGIATGYQIRVRSDVAVLAAPPVITDFTPKSGTNGTIVTLIGANFSPSAANNIVYFGAVRAQVTAASAASLTVSLPVGATFAPPTVTVAGLSGVARAPFMPTFRGDDAPISPGSFAPRIDIPNPMGAIRTVIADLDGDGLPDMAVAGGVMHGISLYRNIGAAGALTEASFAPRVDIPTLAVADSPWDLVAADVDSDGKLDLLEANRGSNVVTILRNVSTPGSLGTDSFAPGVDLVGGDLPLGILVRDMDGDGRSDVVVANFNSANIAVFRNLGGPGTLTAGSFAAPVFFATEPGTHTLSADDLDGDGKPDLAAANANADSVSILRNTSTPGTIDAGSFAPQFSLPAPAYTHFVKTADLDGDSKPDLLVASVHGQALSVYRNIATVGSLNSGSFEARVDFPLGGRGHTISLGDLNGDNKLDVVVDTEINSYVSVFQNQSTPGAINTSSLGARVDLGTGWNAWGASVGDLDGDGRPDIVFANTYDNTISLYRNISSFAPVSDLPPVIASQPVDETVPTGGTASFSVVATGAAPLAYQWLFIGDALDGATNSVLTLSNVQPSQAGSYSVTVSNTGGMVTSSNAVLTVVPTVDVVVDGSTPGLYNDSLGTILDGTQPQFPIPYFSGGGDPDIYPADEPSLAAAAAVLGDWLAPTPVLNGNWRYEAAIPSTWALNSETAIIYLVDGGEHGLANVRGDFDADNGLFVWVNGQYKFGAIQPGSPSPAGQFEYANVDLGNLLPGTNYIQILREDNGISDGYQARIYSLSTTPHVALPAGAVSWWKAEDNAMDSVGSNHGSLVGNVTYTNGQSGQAFNFDGASYVKVPDSPSLHFTNAMTVETWINLRTFSGANSREIVSKYGGPFANQYEFTFAIDPALKTAYYIVNSASSYAVVRGATTIPLNQWIHLAGTYDGATVRIYLNGELDGETPFAQPISLNNNPLVIGCTLQNFSYPTSFFNGLIDEVTLYNRGLGSNEIAAIYAAGSAGKCPLPPSIVAMTPPGAFVNEGDNVSFTATAAGSPPLTYQWQFNGDEITGATDSTLSLSNVVFAQAGNYSVVVTGPGGTASTNVVLAVNRLPLADASATKSLVVSPNGSNAVVVLDGSRSSDPDGDALTCAWYLTGASNAFATGCVASVTLPLGTNLLTLVVHDELASSSQDFTVEVITFSAAFDQLRELVRSCDLGRKAFPLLAALRAAEFAQERGHTQRAIIRLKAFKFWVRALVQPDNPDLAMQLLQEAQAIIAALGGNDSSPPPVVCIESITPAGGQVHLRIAGESGRVFIVEVSSNMSDWTPLGEATESGTNTFEFDDDTTSLGPRYYRVVAPE